MLTKQPRNITIAPNPNKPHQVIIKGHDQYNNPIEETINVSDKELKLIEVLFRNIQPTNNK
jgi:hypothetical protein